LYANACETWKLIVNEVLDLLDKSGVKPPREDMERILTLISELKRINYEIMSLLAPTRRTNTRSTTRDSTEPPGERHIRRLGTLITR